MDVPVATLIGFFLGFAFGVGCALAVMYSIYRGGYRAAMRDVALSQSVGTPGATDVIHAEAPSSLPRFKAGEPPAPPAGS